MKKIVEAFMKVSYIKWIGICALIGAGLGFIVALTEDTFDTSMQALTMTEIEAMFQLRKIIFSSNFIGGLSVLMILSLWMIYLLYQFKQSKSREDVFENPLEKEKIYETKIERALMLSTIATVGSHCWLGTTLALKEQLSSQFLLLIPLAMLLFISLLQKRILDYHNEVYPDKPFNLKDIDAHAEYFKRLDEGEKWIVYQACYKAFMSIDQIFTIFLAALLVFNFFFRGVIFPVLLISIIWILLKIIYFREVRKYNVG
ncbi:Protein of unknown function [Natronincola peptidivorans]|uniref:DUF3169 domain-containing protein n=1 Tax=Natronincola peptidivorans TaxID=426128 RepID=A0A1H9ZLF0_9FIRM|nr:DUF3169 family protein [Natronincola peptidivorans]SES82444.1 Protein of unknown function [Natronincola peptidivorans]